MRPLASLILFLGVIVPAGAESVGSVLARGAALEKSGQLEAARVCYLEARTENPEATVLLFAFAGVEVALGEAELRSGALESARERFEMARETFGRCGADTRLGRAALANRAAALLHAEAVMKAAKESRDARLEIVETSVRELEQMAPPEGDRIARLLDQARYRRAAILREPETAPSPPPESENEGDSPVSEVVEATTQLPNTRAVVEEGAIVVLREEETP